MISYSQLFGWRNLCEYLDAQWYKFATVGEIKANCKCCLPNLYTPKMREHRQLLYEKYLIQFITFQEHPILLFRDSKRNRHEYGDVWGWRLMKDWEAKIDYLEKLVLLDREPEIKTWEADLRRRLADRRRRQEALEQKQRLLQMKESDRKRECAAIGICWKCLQPMAFLMVDCVNCGAKN